MAREIFLLGYDESANPEDLPQAIETATDKLGQLGVGKPSSVKPTIFRPAGEAYAKIAGALFTAFDAQVIYERDPLESPWSLPFNGRVQAAACLSGISAQLPHRSGAEKSYQQQRIIIGERELSDEFLRLNPTGIFIETLNLEAGEPLYNYAYRVISL